MRATIYGAVIDPSYSRVLGRFRNLPIADIVALDRVQKGLPVDADALRRIRRAGLVEGRRPSLRVSAVVARETATEAEYIRHRARDDSFYRKLILDYLRKFGSANRRDFETLIFDELPSTLSLEQKSDRVSNLLTTMRRAGLIQSTGAKRHSVWILAEELPIRSQQKSE